MIRADVARAAIGANIELHGFGLNWEFETPIRRAFIANERTVSTWPSSCRGG